jgi:hypothetical protein
MGVASLGATKNYQAGSATNSMSVTKLTNANCYVIHATNESSSGIYATSVKIGALDAIKLLGLTTPTNAGRNEVWIYLGSIPDGDSLATVNWSGSCTSVLAVSQFSGVNSYSTGTSNTGSSGTESVSLTGLLINDGLIFDAHHNYNPYGVTPGSGQTELYEHYQTYQTCQGSIKTKSGSSETMSNTMTSSNWSSIGFALYDVPPGRTLQVPAYMGL